MSEYHHPPKPGEYCKGFWVVLSVFEHVAQQFLHGGVPDGPVEEQQLYPLRVHETQRGEEEEQLSEPGGAKRDTSATQRPGPTLR